MALTQGSIDIAAIFNGNWSDIRVNSAGPGVVYAVGNAPDGVLTIEQTVSEHRGTEIPALIDTVLPQTAGMIFEATIEEHRLENWNMLIGELPETAGTTKNPGIRIKSNYLTVTGTRVRNEDSTQIVFVIHRGAVTNDVPFGGSPDAVGSPTRFVATKDTAASMGSGGSTVSPLGTLYIPSAISTVTGL